MAIQQISVFLENRAGQLADITSVLAASGTDLRAVNIAETADYGVVRLVADDVRRAAMALSEADYVLSLTPVVAVEVPDRPGGLSSVLCFLADKNVSVEYMYSMLQQERGTAFMVFRVAKPEELEALLTSGGFHSATAEELGIC